MKVGFVAETDSIRGRTATKLGGFCSNTTEARFTTGACDRAELWCGLGEGHGGKAEDQKGAEQLHLAEDGSSIDSVLLLFKRHVVQVLLNKKGRPGIIHDRRALVRVGVMLDER